jgi:MFS family permease
MEINTQQLSRNLRAYYASKVDILALTVVGIITLWLESGMTLGDILLLQGIFGLFVMLLEFPSGVLADVTSRRKVLIMGYIGEVLGLAVYLVGNTFAWFILAEFFFGISLAFKSGADTAMIYDSYVVHDRKAEGEAVIATGRSYRFASMIFLQVLGGFLATVSIPLTIWISIVWASFQLFLYYVSVEPIRSETKDSAATTKGALSKLRDITLIRMFLVFAVFAVFLRVAFWDYIPRFQSVGLEAWTFGLILSGANVVAFSASLLVRRYKSLQSQINVYAVLGLVGVALWVFADSVLLVFVAIGFHQTMRGGLGVAQVITVNRVAESDVRASVHSLISAMGNGLYFLVSVSFEFLDFGTDQILQWSLWLTLLLTSGAVGLGFKSSASIITPIIAD